MNVTVDTLTVRLGASNVYLVPRDDGYIAIDAGANYRGAWREARAQLAAFGIALQAVDTVLLTHGHLDHCGLALHWQRAGARIAVATADAEKVRHGGRDAVATRAAILAFLAAAGVPDGLIAVRPRGGTRTQPGAVREGGDSRFGNLHSIPAEHGTWPGLLRPVPCAPDLLVEPPTIGTAAGGLALPGCGALRIWLAPGHTPGSIVLFDERSDDLFTGDHVLERIAPTAGIALAADGSRLRMLPLYLRSLQATKELRPRRVLPGHGEPFTDLAPVIDRIIGVFEQRAARAHRRLREGGPASPWALALRIYPHLRSAAVWLIMAEIIGLLDLLEERGLVRVLPGDAVVYETT